MRRDKQCMAHWLFAQAHCWWWTARRSISLKRSPSWRGTLTMGFPLSFSATGTTHPSWGRSNSMTKTPGTYSLLLATTWLILQWRYSSAFHRCIVTVWFQNICRTRLAVLWTLLNQCTTLLDSKDLRLTSPRCTIHIPPQAFLALNERITYRYK